jgi:hypothetical protein
VSHKHSSISRREFLETTALSSAIGLKGFSARHGEEALSVGKGQWRIPLRVTERAGVSWNGERVSVGVVVPSSCGALAVRLKDEQTAELMPFAAGYAARTSSGRLRWFQLSIPLHLAAGAEKRLIVELVDDAGAPGVVVPGAVGMESIQALDLGTSAAGIRWVSDPTYGIYPSPTIGGTPLADAATAWTRIAIGDLSAPNGVTGGHLPLEKNETAPLFRRMAGAESTVLDYQRTLRHGAYGAGYEIRQIHSCDLPNQDAACRPYALCDLITFVHAGKDGIPLEVEGLALLLGSSLRNRFVWQARGDAADPAERKRSRWQGGLMLPPGDWIMVGGEDNTAMLVIPWSAYALDGYDLSYFLGRTETITIPGSEKVEAHSLLGGDASEGLAVALSRSYYRLNWGWAAGPDWGRNTYEFRCRLAWGKIDESTAARLAQAYRRPPRVEAGEPERVGGSVALRCWPHHFTYTPGDHVQVELEAVTETPAAQQMVAQVQVQHRGRSAGPAQRVVLEPIAKRRLRGVWTWLAPQAAGGGYLITGRLLDGKVSVEAPPVPIEVLRRPQDLSQQIRMANIAELYPDRDVNTVLDRFVDARINAVLLRNVFDNGQYTGPVDGFWDGAEGCQAGDIGRAVRISGGHLRQCIEACHARGITVIVYGNLRNLQECQYARAHAAGLLGPEDVDLNARRWPLPQDTINFRGRASSERWEQYLVTQLTDGMRRLGYDGYFFDNTSYVNDSEPEMAHRIFKATLALRPDQFIQDNPGPAMRVPGPRKNWRDPRDAEITRWPEVSSIQMEQEGINSPDEILFFSLFYRKANDQKTPVMYMNDPTRRSPEAQLLRVGYLLAGKATDDLCVGNSSHDAGVFFEQCPVTAAVTRALYGGMAVHPELLEPGPALEGAKAEGMEKAAVLAYDALAVGGRSRTLVIANSAGWDAPLRNVGYYWDGKPTIRPVASVAVTLPVPTGRQILGCWVVRPEGWSPIAWHTGPRAESIKVALDEVAELAAVVVRFLK